MFTLLHCPEIDDLESALQCGEVISITLEKTNPLEKTNSHDGSFIVDGQILGLMEAPEGFETPIDSCDDLWLVLFDTEQGDPILLFIDSTTLDGTARFCSLDEWEKIETTAI